MVRTGSGPARRSPPLIPGKTYLFAGNHSSRGQVDGLEVLVAVNDDATLRTDLPASRARIEQIQDLLAGSEEKVSSGRNGLLGVESDRTVVIGTLARRVRCVFAK